MSFGLETEGNLTWNLDGALMSQARAWKGTVLLDSFILSFPSIWDSQ